MRHQTDRPRLHPLLYTLVFVLSLVIIPNLYFFVFFMGTASHSTSLKEIVEFILFISIFAAMFGGIPALLTALFSYQFKKIRSQNDTKREKMVWFGLTLLFGTVISIFCLFVMALIFLAGAFGNDPWLYVSMGVMGFLASLMACSGILLLEWLMNRKKSEFLTIAESV